ncbi:hypothetical protein BC351_28050 [Paenibacillus ferrarius]|uniref:Uncharacterized protein n=1 Tax=Paenibacillus ferrarius TaxID=1469647 RepID=A0A1V4HI61_9BACL|nr:hypothetical protein BC351_28050 [Paenibacillus ferrarius]
MGELAIRRLLLFVYDEGEPKLSQKGESSKLSLSQRKKQSQAPKTELPRQRAAKLAKNMDVCSIGPHIPDVPNMCLVTVRSSLEGVLFLL